MAGPIILQIVLIFLNATFASAEIAVISMSETHLKKLTESGDARAVRLTALTEQPARFLATIQVAITLAGLLGSAFAAENFAGPLVNRMVGAGVTVPENILKSAAVLIITMILAYFNLVFGELVPKRIAMKKAESLALGMSGLLYGVSKAFAPLVFLLTVSTNFVLRILGINPEEEEEQVTEEEIRMLILEGSAQGNIDAEEKEMIQNVFRFDDICAEQICTHRRDIETLYMEDSLEKWEETIEGSRHTHYPICGEDAEDIIGILDTKDYFRMKEPSKEKIMEHAARKPYFISENMRANILFRNMKVSRNYFAVVIDEYGGVSGIVTLHDLMEALVGDLYEPEEGEQPEEIVKTGECQWMIQGSADIEEAAQAFGIPTPEGDFDTFGGFICKVIDRIPDDGEQFKCNTEELDIQVVSVENHRICRCIVQRR